MFLVILALHFRLHRYKDKFLFETVRNEQKGQETLVHLILLHIHQLTEQWFQESLLMLILLKDGHLLSSNRSCCFYYKRIIFRDTQQHFFLQFLSLERFGDQSELSSVLIHIFPYP